MKIRFSNPSRSGGSVLIVGLVIAGILGLSLLSYLSLVHSQNVSVARAQAWNAALTMAESGVEEALAQLNPGALVTNILANNGWALSDGFYQPGPPPRELIGGYYQVGYSPGAPPIIYSTGYTTIPALGATIQRRVEVKTASASLFGVGVVAKYNITMNGNNVATDSYDSIDSTHSTGGLWNISNRLLNGDIASTYGLVSVGNGDVNGRLLLGPTASSSVGPGGVVTGGVMNDFNVDFPDVLAPFQTGTGPTVNNQNYSVGNDNYYFPGNLSLGNNKKLTVTGNAVLYVTGNFSMNQNAMIVIATNASLKLFVGGPSAPNTSTTFGQITNSNTAASFQYYGLPNNTSITLVGNANFVGTIYAPNANFTASGSGNNNADIQGAVVVNSITMNGHFNLHYDENLRRVGPPRGYVAISWKEF
jgi:hypothetical protein